MIGMIAEAQDLFKKAGGNVTIYHFDGGKMTRDAMVAGRVDIGVLGATPFVVGAAKGEVVAIGMAMYAGKTLSVVASINSGITDGQPAQGQEGRLAGRLGHRQRVPEQDPPRLRAEPQRRDYRQHPPPQRHRRARGGLDRTPLPVSSPIPRWPEWNGLGKVLVD